MFSSFPQMFVMEIPWSLHMSGLKCALFSYFFCCFFQCPPPYHPLREASFQRKHPRLGGCFVARVHGLGVFHHGQGQGTVVFAEEVLERGQIWVAVTSLKKWHKYIRIYKAFHPHFNDWCSFFDGGFRLGIGTSHLVSWCPSEPEGPPTNCWYWRTCTSDREVACTTFGNQHQLLVWRNPDVPRKINNHLVQLMQFERSTHQWTSAD